MSISSRTPLSGNAHLAQAIGDILSPSLGTRIMRRDYGSFLFELLDQRINGSLPMLLRAAIALRRRELRLRITRMIITGAPDAGRISALTCATRTPVPFCPTPFALAVRRRLFPDAVLIQPQAAGQRKVFTHAPSLNDYGKAEGARAILPASLAVIGLVATATATGAEAITALDAALPLNTQVLIAGNVAEAAGRAGTAGTLKPALTAIAVQASAIVVVVRVTEGSVKTPEAKAAPRLAVA